MPQITPVNYPELIFKYSDAISHDRELLTWEGDVITVEFAELLIRNYIG